MISWHKVGQKVTPVEDRPWHPSKAAIVSGLDQQFPEFGVVYTIAWVSPAPMFRCGVALGFVEMNDQAGYAAANFRPVYPTAIEALRSRCVPDDALENERHILDLNHFLSAL